MDINTDAPAPAPAPAGPPASKAVLYARFDRSFGFEFAFLIFLTPPLIVLWAFVPYFYYVTAVFSYPILKVAVYYTAGFALARLLYGNSQAARRDKGIVLDGERIVKKDGSGVSFLEYADIRGVRCTKNPLFNKKMIVALASGDTSLPLNLRGSYKMVETVFEKLAALGHVKEDEKKTAAAKRRLYVTAVQYNALYKLRGKHINIFTAVLAASAFFNGAVATLYWERDLATALAWAFAGIMFQTLGYLAAERFWSWKLFDRAAGGIGINMDNADNNDRDGYELFKTIHTVAAIVALLAGMTAGIAVTLPAF